MHSEVRVVLSPQQEMRFDLDASAPLANEAARQWLDVQFTQLDCEPLRASGKVLLADKVLVVAQAASVAHWADAQWAQTFAQAASAVLARPLVRIDVPAMAVTF
ncbi:hypothetical protein G7045_11245 [Acidovorax sp. HDW3]|uniref:hypothetical protein n=1 Tax=Acidovorax sp. HDW3 TaxID=2714923 RepID=UPI00140A7C5F|nr:hypothetical protein [Acidovorax sp. HDW3]QIL44791.1 hypothetical protein G7045_11245 [Acidovorax sp. HDW3]